MLKLSDIGIECIKSPLLKVRIIRVDGQWCVEYQRQPRWVLGIDKWWWFNDGKYVDYSDALDRAHKLTAQGYAELPRYISKEVFDVAQ